MSFQAPLWLLALLALPAAVVAQQLLARRARRYSVRFPAVDTLAAVLPRSARWRRWIPLGFYLLALATLAVALARPQRSVAVPVDRSTVILVTDTSNSMMADDVEPSRLAAAQRAGLRFLEAVPRQHEVGAVAFSSTPYQLVPPTAEHDEIRDVVESLSPDGGTATGDALASALQMLGNRDRERPPPAAIVLLSDGKATAGREPIAVARQAGRAQVPIYTVALGTRGGTIRGSLGSVLPVPPDPETMREISRVSGGRAFRADNADQLTGLYEELGSAIGTKTVKRQVTSAFAAGGLLALVLGAGLSLRWRGRLP
jgi:Ca-activated chloride channel family protein